MWAHRLGRSYDEPRLAGAEPTQKVSPQSGWLSGAFNTKQRGPCTLPREMRNVRFFPAQPGHCLRQATGLPRSSGFRTPWGLAPTHGPSIYHTLPPAGPVLAPWADTTFLQVRQDLNTHKSIPVQQNVGVRHIFKKATFHTF